ncbi:hypothetical protein [Luteolibacter algae]
MRCVYFNPPAGAPDVMFAHVADKVIEVPMPSMNLSTPLDPPSGEYVVRFSDKRVLPPETPAGDTVNLKLTENDRKFILLVYPNPKQKGLPITVSKVTIDSSFPLGSMMWINTTRNLVGGKIGTETLLLKPGAIVRTKAPSKEKGGYSVRLDYQAPKSREQKMLVNTMWRHDPNSRQFIFVTSMPDTDIPAVNAVADFEMPEPVTP